MSPLLWIFLVVAIVLIGFKVFLVLKGHDPVEPHDLDQVL